MSLGIPSEVRNYVLRIFSDVNDKVTRKISTTPNIPEESLDISFIERLSEYSAPRIVAPNWAVRIAAHFIGNIRHRRRYEIADLGIVVVFKKGSTVQARKLVLLQSKRLYPKNNEVIEFEDFDYDLGLALVTRNERMETPIFSNVLFEFDVNSSYGALKAKSHQCEVIQEHFDDTNIPVHYLLYNPIVLPWSISYPASIGSIVLPKRKFGARIVHAKDVHDIFRNRQKGEPLKLSDFPRPDEGYTNIGFSLENFIENVIRCRQGYRFDGSRDVGLDRLFSRKSGPIFCVVEIVIEKGN